MHPVRTKYISKNRSGEPLINPIGVVVHSTATPGATAYREYQYFNSRDVQSSAHSFTDWDETIITVPFTEIAWHAGRYANPRFVGCELCEPLPGDTEKFKKIWNNGVEFIHWAMIENNLNSIVSHNWVTFNLGGTDHSDPIGFFARFGKTFEDFVNAVITFQPEKEKDKGEDDMQPVSVNKDMTKWHTVAKKGDIFMVHVSSGDGPGVPEPAGDVALINIYSTANANWVPVAHRIPARAALTVYEFTAPRDGILVFDSINPNDPDHAGASIIVQKKDW